MRFRLVKSFIEKGIVRTKVRWKCKDFVEFGYNFCLHEMLLKSRTKLNAILAPYKSYFYSPSSPFLPSSFTAIVPPLKMATDRHIALGVLTLPLLQW
jgi:hypothetical protein